ncbi:DnaD family protein [Mesoplasma seiffertii]|uniref:DnaD family protein n=1 Tax=Mesoplasma seiffertii TaxID=28224 RepID=UPI000478767D|nr:DnaD family protein [Mesoplasma seiffertii]
MLIDLLKKGVISKDNLLFDNYKKIGLNENQVMIVKMIMHISKSESKFVTPRVVATKMTLSETEIENEIETMIEKGLVKIVAKNIDFSPLFIKLAISSEQEYLALEDKTFIATIQEQLSFELEEEQIKELANIINVNVSKKQLLEILSSEDTINTYGEFVKRIGKLINNKPKGITKFNWLDN